MEQINFTDEQLLNLVNNSIKTKTEFEPDDFTGGSVGITSTNNHTQTNMRVSLFFGYLNKKPVTRNITINNDTYYIWTKALLLKVMSLKNDNLGINYSELNALMNGVNLSMYSISKKEKKSIVEVGSVVDLQVDLPHLYELQIEEQEAEKVRKINIEELTVTTAKGDYTFADIKHLKYNLKYCKQNQP